MSAGNILRILTYHRVTNPEHTIHSDPNLVSATPEMFTRHMKWLERHYQAIDMQQALDAVVDGAPLPQRAVLITFDDGYPDFREFAWPVLRQLGLPVTLFVPTAFPGQQISAFWWDRLYAAVNTSRKDEIIDEKLGCLQLHTHRDRARSALILRYHARSLPHTEAMAWIDDLCLKLTNEEHVTTTPMSWQDLRLLSEQGVTIGAHSRTHPLMTQITNQQVYDEIAGAQQDIETMLGKTLPIFCYPAGAYNHTIGTIARNSGIKLGFGTYLGHNNLNNCNPLCLKRINMTRRTTPTVLRGRLSRVGIHADVWRHKIKKYLRGN